MKTVITLLGTVICTLLIYYLLFDEYGTLFYVNVISTCVIEVVLLSGIPLFSSKKLLTFKNAASWTIITVFAFLFFLWTTFYTIGLADGENMDTLYIGQLVIGVLFIILFGMTEIGSSAMQKHDEALHTTIKAKKRTLFSVENYWLDISELLSNSSDWENETRKQIRNVLDKLSSIPARKVEENGDILDEIHSEFKELKRLCEQLAEENEKDKLQQKITKKVSQIRNYVVTVKTQF